MSDYLFRGDLESLDSEVNKLTQVEAERQFRRLILIPSESTAPEAVLEALSSTFNNIYAEGYPHPSTRRMAEEEILDHPARLAHYRRYSAPRYYKGVEYADAIEALARRRCAVLFAANGLGPDDLHVNVQPLSGAPASNAVYHSLLKPDDTMMGMDLMQGGHLTHGSPVNRSGKLYRSVHYGVDPDTERLDYDAILELAIEHRPKMIVSGYSSYPWVPDWQRFREIADSVGAYLLADIAHIAGPIAAGVIPSPIGIADVVTFTTHKSLCGPRGAAIVTHSKRLAAGFDKAVFPGEQGGPHMNTIAAQAVAFKLAATEQFRELQVTILANCEVLNQALDSAGLRIPFGGTNTHLTNVDCSSIRGPDGTALSGDMAARILDLAGIVVNRNTIPGDKTAARPSGIRIGTVWISQRGFGKSETTQLGALIAELLHACRPYRMAGRAGPVARAKVDYDVLTEVQHRTRDLAVESGIDYEPPSYGYPHFYYEDDPPSDEPYGALSIQGPGAEGLIRYSTNSRPLELEPGDSVRVELKSPGGVQEAILTRTESRSSWQLSLDAAGVPATAAWLRALSDGYIEFDPDDLRRKPPGPAMVEAVGGLKRLPDTDAQADGADKPWYFGAAREGGRALPKFEWNEGETQNLRRTALFETHQALGAKLIPFAGWEMPVWYSSVFEEHTATRTAAGLFDVSHMGVYRVKGEQAAAFLDSLVANDVAGLELGASIYTQFLDPAGHVLDDAIVYRLALDGYLVVVNAANDSKLWKWLNLAQAGAVFIDQQRPWTAVYGRHCELVNLRDPGSGDLMLVDLALQGPKSGDILLALGSSEEARTRLEGLKWAGLMEGVFGGFNLVVSRTGYTGEREAFELFTHPESSPELWSRLMEVGEPMGLKPAGLGARDSLRTEAGLPLYGQELAGDMDLGVGDAGFASYVKTYKPWFVGRASFLAQELEREREVVRFRFKDKGVRMAHYGDLVLNGNGREIGTVTSCAIDGDRYLTGQAHIALDEMKVGNTISIVRGSSTSPAAVVRRFARF